MTGLWRLARFAKLAWLGVSVRGPKGRCYALRFAWLASRRHCYPYSFFAAVLRDPPRWDVLECGCGVCWWHYEAELRKALEGGEP